MMRNSLAGAAIGALLLAAVPTFVHSADPAMVADTAKGKVLADAKGMTLYTFDRDTAGKSACSGQCATNWPPLMVTGNAMASGKWSIVTRDDGSKQWAYDGKPLYLWVKDTKPGDTTGDGVNNVWKVAKP